MNAIIYVRVSTEEQAREGFSLASQLDACRKKAQEMGATNVIEFADEGVSGEILERPGLTRSRDLVRAGGIEIFLCYDPDRLSRKAAHQMIITEEIEQAHVRLEFVNFDRTSTPEGNMFYQMRGVIAEYEKEKIKERTIRGKLQKAKQGGLTHWPGTYGYSYTRRDGRQDGFVAVNEEEAEVVRSSAHCAPRSPSRPFRKYPPTRPLSDRVGRNGRTRHEGRENKGEKGQRTKGY